MTDEDLEYMLFKASDNGNEITFEEFYEIMTKNTFS